MMVASIFSSFHNVTIVLYPVKDRNHHFTALILSSANAFNLVETKILSFGKELTLYQLIPSFIDPIQTVTKELYSHTIQKNKTFENIAEKGDNGSIFSISYSAFCSCKVNLNKLKSFCVIFTDN